MGKMSRKQNSGPRGEIAKLRAKGTFNPLLGQGAKKVITGNKVKTSGVVLPKVTQGVPRMKGGKV